MMYIIDGNNLAGKLDLLRDESCNQKVIDRLSQYFGNTKKEVVLVFDSVDPLGDKYTVNNLTVIYSPRDGHYVSADDKIMELIDNNRHREVTVVSDDIEIRKKVEELNSKGYNNLNNKKASDLAFDIEDHKIRQENKNIDKRRGLSDDEVDEMNEELLEQFKQKKNKNKR